MHTLSTTTARNKKISKREDQDDETRELSLYDLPAEVLFKIMSFLPIKELGILSICSNWMHGMVLNYVTSKNTFETLKAGCWIHGNPSELTVERLEHFRNMGVLAKRLTFLYPTSKRLEFLEDFLHHVFTIPCFRENHYPVFRIKHISLFQCFGKLLLGVVAGWEEHELENVVSWLEEKIMITKYAQSVLTAPLGTFKYDEMYLRYFYLYTFIENAANNADSAFWISKILQPFTSRMQVNLILLIFGPLHMRSAPTVGSNIKIDDPYYWMSQMFNRLYQFRKEWTKDRTVKVIEELISVSSGWFSENSARLLFFCKRDVTIAILNDLLKKSRLSEAAMQLMYITQLCMKHEITQKDLFDFFHGIGHFAENPHVKLHLFSLIPKCFSATVNELLATQIITEDIKYKLKCLSETQSYLYSIVLPIFMDTFFVKNDKEKDVASQFSNTIF